MSAITLNARNARGRLVNADTGETILYAFWSDLESGEYLAYRINPKLAKLRNIPLRSLVYRGQARLRFEPAKLLPTSERPVRAPAPRPQLGRGTPIIAHAQRPCQHYACTRAAAWRVADEESLPAQEADGRLYECAQLIGIRYYCDHHFEQPKLWDSRGELICEHEVKARPD